jgi:site-specific DNA-methyltransferase (adenine-specific)
MMIVEQMLKNAPNPILHIADVSGSALFQGDCLDIMPLIPDKSVQLILADLPYGTTACKWDSVIPFDLMWEHLNRIIKPNGAIVLFGSEPFSSALRMSNIKNYKEDIVWLKNKSSNGFQIEQKHLKVHENIMVFSNQTKYKFNPQKWLVQEKEFLTQRKTLKEFECGNNVYGSAKRVRKLDDGTRNPISIITASVPITMAKNKTYGSDIDVNYHPTQKPLSIMEYLVKSFTDENDTVLDFTMGVCSTGIACINTNRNFIGIELDENYLNISKKRVEEKRKEKDLQAGTLFGNEM